MSLLWVEGFEWLGTGADSYVPNGMLAEKYYSAPSNSTAYLRAGRTGGYAIEGIYNSTQSLYPLNAGFSTASDTYITGFAIRPMSSFGTVGLVTFRKSGNTAISLRINSTTKEIEIWDRASTLKGTTIGVNLTALTWYYIELKIKDAVLGTVEIHVNGQVVAYLTNIDTTGNGTPGINDISWAIGINGSYGIRLDDIYFCNGAGATNNDFLGNAVVASMFPTSDGAALEWALSAGSDHYALVDEAPDTADTDYVSAASADTKDTYGYADVADLGTIHGVQTNTVMKEMTVVAVPTMKTLVKSGATTYDQTLSGAITTGYKSYYTINETDPATTAAWALADLNSAEFGIKRV
jgi:hypothetical protein